MLASREERQKTDVWAIYFSIGLVVVLFGFVGYAFFNGSIYRTINGIDDCGYICGRDNPKNNNPECEGKNSDMREFPLTLVNYTQSRWNENVTFSNAECVKTCYTGYKEIANRCFKSSGNDTDFDETSILQEVMSDLSNTWYHIVGTCLVALVFSYMILILFRYAIKYVIWIIYIGIVVLFIVIGVVFIVFYFVAKGQAETEEDKNATIGLIVFSAVFFVVGIILALVLYFFRKRIRLVIQLFKEASKALIDVPMIITEPILTFFAIAFASVTFVYFAMVCFSSGKLQKQVKPDGSFYRYEYVQNAGTLMANLLNVILYTWFTAFIFGCQNFVIAGTVSQWFFSRNKDKLDSPVMRAFRFLMEFHIGSICFGSILITLMKIINAIISGIKEQANNSQNQYGRILAECCSCIFKMLEELLEYLTRNAYIIVAMDGTPLVTSGKKAFHLLKDNLVDVIALNKLGDFVLFLGKVFVTVISGFVCYELVAKKEGITHVWAPVLISCIFAYLIVDCFMTVYEMTIDTIFICFCEDSIQNDGDSRPYYMSQKLMQAMRDIKSAAGGEFNFGGENPESGTRPLNPPPHMGFVGYNNN